MPDISAAIAALSAQLPHAAGEVVVVFRTDKIGDLLVTSPLFRAIKAARPDAYVILIASPYNQAVLANMPQIDRIVAYDDRADWRQKLRFASALRRLHPACVLVMSPGSDGYWMARLSGARRRAGVVMSYRQMQRLTAPLLLNAVEVIHRKRLDRTPDRHFHVSDIALRLAARCGFPRPADVSQSAPTSAAERAWAAGIAGPGPRIVLHLGETWRACGLDEAAMITLVARIGTAFPTAHLLLTAGPADQAYGRALHNTAGAATLFSGLSLGHWSALIESADLVVTPDTGAVHLASAHRRPVVAVYAPHRFNAMTSLFGPWQTPYRTLRGGGDVTALQDAILAAMAALNGSATQAEPS